MGSGTFRLYHKRGDDNHFYSIVRIPLDLSYEISTPI